MIFESAQQVKAAIRMANNEVDKIRDLKLRKDEEEKKLEARKDENIKKGLRESELEGEITDLIVYSK